MLPTQNLKNNLVVKSNELIMASYAMTVNEQRVLISCISQIDSRQTLAGEAVFRLSVEQARDLFYTKGDQRHAYRDLKEACERLFERKVRIDLPDNKELLTRFVQSVVFDPDNGHADIRFAKEILPYLSQLEANFTKYRLENVVQLTSFHAIRIYELIVSWAGQGQFYKEMLIDDFRMLLGLGEKYKQNGELKRFVIDKAIEQINENTDFELDIAFKKSKRTFKWIQLRFNQKTAAKAAEQEAKKQRETRALRNQAAAQKRKETEVVQAAADNAAALLAEFEALPDGVRYTRLSDGSEWCKSGGVLHCAAANTSVAPAQIGRALASGEFVREGEVRQPENYQGEFAEETADLPDHWEEETEEQQEAAAHQIEFMERELKLIALRERGLISEEKFLEMMIGTPPKEFLEAYEAAELPPSETPPK